MKITPLRHHRCLAAALVALLVTPAIAAARQETLTIEQLLDIRHPSRPVWSPDGRQVAFIWDRAGVQNVHVADATTAGQPRPLTSFREGLLDIVGWPDQDRLLFTREGDLFAVDPATGAVAQVWSTTEPETGVVLSADQRTAAFERGGDLWTRDLASGREQRLTDTPAIESGAVWSPDGRYVAFTVITADRRSDAPAYHGAKIAFTWFDRSTPDVAVVAAGGGATTRLGATSGSEAAPRWIDSTRLVFQRVTEDLKSREIVVADAVSGDASVIQRETGAKWWSLTYLNPEPQPSPDGRWVAFISDRDGWDHLYLVPSGGGEARQLTRGASEITRLRWSPDSRTIVFDRNERAAPGVRHLASIALDERGAAAEPVVLTSGRGTNTEAVWSPDGRRIVYQHTDPRNSADLFVMDARAGAVPVRLSDSMPGIDRARLVEPRLVHYASADGQQVPAYLFVPPGLDTMRRHPAIVWVHGDGVTQNYDGWHARRDYAVYYSFHQYLAQRGYVVLAVDYRGSIGYGRAWREGHYRDLGGKDYEDVAAGKDYLATLGYVDGNRVGVWGLSYGGFMTLRALTVTPDRFACGIDVAGVVDWRDWYRDPDGPWIKGRMGNPADDPELYRRTAPIEDVAKIVRPLMVLHGTADVNVPYEESARFVDAALKADRDVEFMMYPGEFHYFHREHVLRDAWRRVERFFDAHLKGSAGTSSARR